MFKNLSKYRPYFRNLIEAEDKMNKKSPQGNSKERKCSIRNSVQFKGECLVQLRKK